MFAVLASLVRFFFPAYIVLFEACITIFIVRRSNAMKFCRTNLYLNKNNDNDNDNDNNKKKNNLKYQGFINNNNNDNNNNKN